MAPCLLLAALLLGTCAWSADGIRADGMYELLGSRGASSAGAEGSQCTAKQMQDFKTRFQIGAEHGKPCSDEDAWHDHLEYLHPKSPNRIALYIYPEEDDNNAFGFCTDEGHFSLGLCHRIYSQSLHYSVHFHRVESVEEAIALVRALPPEVKIKHLVLGGHGDPTSLAWGDEDLDEGTPELAVEDDVSDEFFDAVYPHLLRGRAHSTVFLDACLNGKVIEEKNMIQHVAHRLAGVQVWASKISWDNDEFELGSSQDFSGKIISETTGVNRMRSEQFGEGPLRTWGFRANAFCDDKASKPEAASELQQCRKACEGKATCKAFVWYPDGNKAKKNKCYLSNGCKETSSSSKGAMTFEKPSGSI
mmetsp:Transcript_65045/g.180381  ORF Transcript_65045/g.180381 Transcript_65045/m.180381 type:complete len:362 (-) Transcript_65045:39-1124(-)